MISKHAFIFDGKKEIMRAKRGEWWHTAYLYCETHSVISMYILIGSHIGIDNDEIIDVD